MPDRAAGDACAPATLAAYADLTFTPKVGAC